MRIDFNDFIAATVFTTVVLFEGMQSYLIKINEEVQE